MSRAAWLATGLALLATANARIPAPSVPEPIGLELHVDVVHAGPRDSVEPSYAALVSCLAAPGSRTQTVLIDVDGTFRMSGDRWAYAVIRTPGEHEVNCVGSNEGSTARRTRSVYVPYPGETQT